MSGTDPTNARWRCDYLLVQQYLRGDQTAWDTLYRQAYPAALRFLSRQPCMKYLQTSDMADILNEAFFRCQTYASRFQCRSSFQSWVCGFVRYVALDEAKKHFSEDRKIKAYHYLYREQNTAPSPEDILIRRERDRCLWLAYDSLPLYHRVLIGYLILEQYTYWDARRVTGLHLKTEMEAELPGSISVFRQYYFRLYEP